MGNVSFYGVTATLIPLLFITLVYENSIYRKVLDSIIPKPFGWFLAIVVVTAAGELSSLFGLYAKDASKGLATIIAITIYTLGWYILVLPLMEASLSVKGLTKPLGYIVKSIYPILLIVMMYAMSK